MPRDTALNKPGAMAGQPVPPARYGPDAKALWRQVVASRPAAVWTPADAMLIGHYVLATLDVDRLDAEIAKKGELMAGKVSPLVKIRAMREARMLALATKLKLTPASRYTAQRVGELHRHARKATAAQAAIDGDDLLAGPMKGRLQ